MLSENDVTITEKYFGFQWHISDRCNMRCKHCYQNDFSDKTEPDLDSLKTMADSVFGTLHDHRISINLTGGEPLIMPVFFDLVDYLHTFSNLDELNIITNGTIASPEVCAKIESHQKINAIKISIESGDRNVNDAIRGDGSFERIQKGIKSFRKHTDKSIVLMMTLGKYNLNTIPETVQFAEDNGIDGIIFERFIAIGHGLGISPDVLDARDWAYAVRKITAASGIETEPEELLPYKAFWLHLSKNHELQGALCNLGRHSMALMPDGTVFPCRRLPVSAGNILHDSFSIIHDALSCYEVPKISGKLHGNLCGICGIDDCAGCRALAYSSGDLLGDDTQCFLSLFE